MCFRIASLLVIWVVLAASIARGQGNDAAKPLGELPWAAKATSETPGQSSRVTDARQLLVNVDPSEYDSFTDGDPLNNDDGTLAKILYRLPRFMQSEVERLAKRDVNWQTLIEEPAEHRVEIVRIEGRVRQVVEHKMPPEMVSLYEFSRYFLVTFDVEGAPHPVIVHALEIPETWKKHLGEPFDERAVTYGLFLQIARENEQPIFHFAARRVAWYPDELNASLDVGEPELLLGKLGVDVGLLDEARQRNRKPLEAGDYEAFYQLLAAARTAATTESIQPVAVPFDLIATLSQPETKQGQWISVRARARRITKIVVESADVRERFGIEHYYQIDSTVGVGDTTIQFQTGKPGEEAPQYVDSFPLTLCALRLPPELEAARQKAEAAGPDGSLNEPIYFEGFFYKLWVYKSRYTTQFDERLMQPSPFFVAYQPQWAPISTAGNTWIGLGMGIGFLICLLAMWIAVWRFNKRDTEVERKLMNRPANDGKSLNDLKLDVKTEPDFSNLDQ